MVPANVEFSKLFGEYRLNEKRPLFAVVAQEGMSFLFTDEEGIEAGVKRNRVPISEYQAELEPLDLIEIGKVRIELSRPGQQYQVCINPACERLNPYNPHVNCRHCGTKLQEARTRVLRARG